MVTLLPVSYTHLMSNFITPKELLACLDEVIILDARGYQDYKQGHIKGSYAVDLNKMCIRDSNRL